MWGFQEYGSKSLVERFRIRILLNISVLAQTGSGAQLVIDIVPPSVADPGCLSRIMIFTLPGSRIQKQQ
jgi:hypothetical protein